jgi:hypothetical protein
VALDVDEVFVPLTLELGGRNKTFTNSNLLEAGSRLVVVGDPGCGKSTLIKRLFRDTCQDTLNSPSHGRLPIRAELKSLAPPTANVNNADAGDWLLQQLKRSVSQIEGFEMSRLFDAWVTDAGLLILLDGLDEVASERYSSVANEIRGLSRRLAELSSNNVVVLTMRMQFHQQVRHELEQSYPLTLYVRPFLPNEIFTFLNRWPFGEDRKQNANRIYSELTDRPTLREMCSNPLVLAMYVENDYESEGTDAPDTRTQFYDKVVTELLIKRRRRQEVATGRAVSLRSQREQILGELALQNLLDPDQPANSLGWSAAIPIVQSVWNCDASDAEGRLRELASETGLISEERPGESLRFMHLTFCEFLAANQCVNGRKDGWQTVLNQHRKFVRSGERQLQTRLIELLPFAHALLPRVNRGEALSDISSLDDRLVLGRCFLETQLYDRPEWHRYLREERDYLARTTENEWGEERIRRLHLFSVVVRDARDWHAQIARQPVSSELDKVFADIVRGNRKTVARVFATYASQDASAAFRLAGQVGVNMISEYPGLLVECCQEEPFLSLALQDMESPAADSWCPILIEAALLYSNVAYRLDSTPATGVPGYDDTIDCEFESMLRFGLVEMDSWYKLLLVKVLQLREVDPRLSAVATLRMCTGRTKISYWMYRARYLTSLITFVAVVFVSPDINSLPVVLQFIFGVPLVLSAFLVSASFVMIPSDLHAIYVAIFNFSDLLRNDNRALTRYFSVPWLLEKVRLFDRMVGPESYVLAHLISERSDESYVRLAQWY